MKEVIQTIKNKPVYIQLGTAVVVVAFIVRCSFAIGAFLETMNMKIEDVSAKYIIIEKEVDELQTLNNSIGNRLGRIEEVLTRVEKIVDKVSDKIYQ